MAQYSRRRRASPREPRASMSSRSGRWFPNWFGEHRVRCARSRPQLDELSRRPGRRGSTSGRGRKIGTRFRYRPGTCTDDGECFEAQPRVGGRVAVEHELEIRCEDGRSDVKRVRGRLLNLAAGASILVAVLAAGPPVAASSAAGTGGCQLNSAHQQIQHVIHIQFDNVHFTRDNPNVPSDLEQMPNLLNFIENDGVLLTNHHTPLISHTATDILTSLTGVYGDQHGMPISNSFRYFNSDGTSNPGVSYAYWTSPLFDSSTSTPTDTTPNMLTTGGKNAPAPWVPYTRAGCNFGAIGTANSVLENTKIDIPTVFGAGSPEAMEASSNSKLAQADFVGIGIHCAAGNALCSTANNGKADVLPDEPGGYSGYTGLFGHKYVAPQISPDGPLMDLDGNPIQDPSGNKGFPGFDGMSAAVSLAYVAAMQEHGVPVTYAYISDAHDAHPSGPAYGPGQAGYVAALKAYDDAFGTFFARLAN